MTGETQTPPSRERSPALGGRKAEAERNDRIVLDAATEVFLELGYEAPMSLIAERAGVGMGSLYRRYRSKDDLIRRLCTVSMERTLDAAERALAEEPDGWSALARFMHDAVRCGAGALKGFAGTIRVTPQMAALAERAAAAMQAIIDRACREGSLRDGVTPGDLTFMCLMLRVNIGLDGARLEELRERYLAVLLDGLSRHRADPLPGRAPGWAEVADRWGPATGLD
jgi:AcrR family transcriptional regulator